MRRLLRFVRLLALSSLALAIVVFVLNTNLLAPQPSAKPLIIAHRGLGQSFHREGITATTCTAARIFPPEHPFLENTLAGFRAAFADGADMVEFDVHPTSDGQFVVFHDWTLDCRTDGHGVTRDHPLAELKALDVGYGYTADGGESFPFRGLGVGLMPTLDEVLAAFPDKRFLINIKSDDPDEGRRLAAMLAPLPAERHARIWVYGGGKAIDAFAADAPDLTVLGTDAAKRCLIRYELMGWLGIVPAACRHTLFMLPINYGGLIWGFPNRLAQRLAAYGTRVVLLGAYDNSGFSSGIDAVAELGDVPAHFDGFIWTNRVDRIGPALAAR